MDTKLEKLKKVIEIVSRDTVSPKDIEQFIATVLNTLEQYKQFLSNKVDAVTEGSVQETKRLVDEAYKEFSTAITSVTNLIHEQKGEYEERLGQLQNLLKEIQSIEVRDGKDGVDGSPDSGEDIVNKINSLDVIPENQIDAVHIKNLPQVTKNIIGGVVSRNIYQMGDVYLSSLVDGQALVWDNTNKRWINDTVAGGSGAWGSITGTLSNQTDLQTALDAKLDGNGVANYVPFYSDANTLTSEEHFNYDSANHRLHIHAIAGDATDGLLIESANGTDIGILGASNTANVTWYGAHNFNAATQDTIAAFTGAGKTLGSLSTTTYPSLTELSYIKGVTSAIQTQLNTKLTSPQIQSLISIRF